MKKIDMNQLEHVYSIAKLNCGDFLLSLLLLVCHFSGSTSVRIFRMVYGVSPNHLAACPAIEEKNLGVIFRSHPNSKTRRMSWRRNERRINPHSSRQQSRDLDKKEPWSRSCWTSREWKRKVCNIRILLRWNHTKLFDTEEKRHMAVKDPSLFPDGGLRGWSVVGASFLLVFCTFGGSRHYKYWRKGITNGFGIFQTYLIQHQLSNYTQDEVAWIGSVQIFLSFSGGLISGRFDHIQVA